MANTGATGGKSGGKEGDWKCDRCWNRNYAFRSFCNRCKQPRLLVDSKTPADSKWLPRIGDWICAGCSNNNYASREKCNKCGQPKEVAALPAMALPGSAMVAPALPRPTTGSTGGLGLGSNAGLPRPLHPPFPLGLNWPFSSSGLGVGTPDVGNWRPGDWMCSCGYHNYSSRSTCKECHAPDSSAVSVSGRLPVSVQPPSYSTVGIKRQAADDMGGGWVSKRLNLGGDFASQPFQSQPPQSYATLEDRLGFPSGLAASGLLNSGVIGGNAPFSKIGMQPPTQVPVQSSVTLVPTILGKGARQWRVGDWMCSGCSNHNFASRATCNRCGGQKEAVARLLPVS